MNEIKKAMQSMKEEINKDIEIMKNNQFEMNSSITQIKSQSKVWQTEWSKLKREYQEQKIK
jgi:vancomycin resistance protein YoaR